VGIPFLTQTGVAAAATVVVAVLVAVTLVPAVLGYLGHRALLAGERTALAGGTTPAVSPHGRGFLAGWVIPRRRGRAAHPGPRAAPGRGRGRASGSGSFRV
jgi:RND superfamily putative drug exporter